MTTQYLDKASLQLVSPTPETIWHFRAQVRTGKQRWVGKYRAS